jgi:hypothetical protein
MGPRALRFELCESGVWGKRNVADDAEDTNLGSSTFGSSKGPAAASYSL